MQAETFFNELLDSGVEVVGQPMAGVESASIGILVGTGARDEAPENYGVSHFAEQMLFRGTQHLDARRLLESFDALGISHGSSAGIEMTLINTVMLGDKVPAALDLIADVVRFPAFPDDSVDNVRALLFQERQQREDRPDRRVIELLRQEFYADSALSHDVLGTDETLTRMNRDALLEYWTDRYTANNITVSIAGKFDWEQIVGQLQRITAEWASGRGRMIMREPEPKAEINVMQKEAAQENIGFAFPAVPAADPHYYAAALLAQAFGGGSNSRIFREVREKRGLAYAAMARFDGYEKSGLFRIYVGTSPERAHESAEVVLEELAKLEADGISEEELSRAKTKLKSNWVMRSESTSARMSANLRSWWFERKIHSLDDIKQMIDRVTVEQIQELIGSLGIRRHLTAVAIGPRLQDELFGAMLARS